MFPLHPLAILLVGIVTILGLIIVLRANAFLALIAAAMVVSTLAPGEVSDKMTRVAEAFGSAAGKIGIVIGLAAIIGQCMMDSGAADKVVRAFLKTLGEKRASLALMGSGYVLAVPVFFDTVFYLLVPLARSLYKRTGKDFLKYVLAIAAGGAVTHTLVPPTPGPLLMAANLNIEVGWMIIIGALVAAPTALAGLAFASFINARMPIPMRELSTEPEPPPMDDSELPSLFLSALPVILPVLLISTNTVLSTLADRSAPVPITTTDVGNWPAFAETLAEQEKSPKPNPGKRLLATVPDATRDAIVAAAQKPEEAPSTAFQNEVVVAINTLLHDREFYQPDYFSGITLSKPAATLLKGRDKLSDDGIAKLNRALLESAYPQFIAPPPLRRMADIAAYLGDANFALLLSAVVAIWVLVRQRSLSLQRLSHVVEASLMSGGVIILITAAGGAFGAMLTTAQIGPAVQELFGQQGGSGLMMLGLGFVVAAVLKIAQGSSTVAMITASGMLAAMGVSAGELGFNPVYLATAIGSGSLIGSWMNDSGFWIVAKMSGLTEIETLKSWTPLLLVLGSTGFVTSLILALVLPMT